MKDLKAIPRIIEALRLRDGVVITFEDGKWALYTAALLYAMFPNADELIQDMNDKIKQYREDGTKKTAPLRPRRNGR
jgi:hypothetical protein